MVITYKKKYDVLDANESIHFKDHIELSDLCFGQHGNLVRAEYCPITILAKLYERSENRNKSIKLCLNLKTQI